MSLADSINIIRSLAAQGKSEVEIAAATGLEIGDVASVLALGTFAGPTLPGGGGSSAGSLVVRRFPFQFDTPDLLTGAAVYTPTIGDILLDAWVEIDEAWDGTTPHFDAGRFLDGYSNGWWTEAGATIVGVPLDEVLDSHGNPIDVVDSTENLLDYGMLAAYSMGPYYVARQAAASTSLSLTALARFVLVAAPAGGEPEQALSLLPRVVPAKFVTADPVRVCVSTSGRTDGADPGSAQGAATLYLVTATPA